MAVSFPGASNNLILTVLLAAVVIVGYIWWTKQQKVVEVPAAPEPVEPPQEVVSAPPQPRMTGPNLASYTDNVAAGEIQPAPLAH